MNTLSAGAFTHPALFYRDDAEYLAGLLPFVTGGLDRGEPVAVAVPPSRHAVLHAALGAAAERVHWVDMSVAGRNPGRIIPTVLRQFADTHADRHAHIIGEPIWPGRTATEYPACVQHEALINHAFAGREVTIVCPYDTARLDPAVVADAHATHPEIWDGDRRAHSDRYDPDEVVARYNQPLRAGAAAAEIAVSSPAELRPLRRWTAAQALEFGLDGERVPQLELIVTELVTNSLRHAATDCLVRLWRAEGHLHCEVRDGGQLSDPLAGRRPRPPGQRGGRGLLLVHQLADLVRTHTTPEGTSQYALLRLG